MSDVVFSPSLGLTFHFDARGDLVGTVGLSSVPTRVPRGALDLLTAFAGGATREVARDRLHGGGIEVDRADFERGIASLLSRGYLVCRGDGAEGPPRAAEAWFGQPLVHFNMLEDVPRVLAYRAAIAAACPGRRVVDLGTGSGVLAVFAAQAGAVRVDAIEETRMAEVALRTVQENGVASIVHVHARHGRDVVLDEPADVLIHELIGADVVGENMLPAVEDAKLRLLKPGGTILPSRLEVWAVGVETGADAEAGRTTTLARLRELERLYGVSFAPLALALRDADARAFLPSIETTKEGRFALPVLTEEVLVTSFDFVAPAPPSPRSVVSLTTTRRGVLGGVFLFFRATLDARTSLTNAPSAPLTSWGHRVHALRSARAVAPGEIVEFSVRLSERSGRQRLEVSEP